MHIELTSENFAKEVFESDKPVLVDFWADWCGPCRMLGPVIEEVAEENPQIKVGKLNVSYYPDIAEKFGVMSIPTLIFFKDGKSVDATVGLVPKSAVEKLISR